MEKLGALKVSPPRGKKSGLADDILGKKPKSLSHTTPLTSLKPLHQLGKDSLSRTQEIPSRKTVRLSDPLETGPSNVNALIPPIGSENRDLGDKPTVSSPRGELPLEIKPILKESGVTLAPTNTESSEEENVNQNLVDQTVDPPVQVEKALISLEPMSAADVTPDEESNQLPELLKSNQSDFNEMASLQAQESLIRQQYNSQTIRRLYSKILDRSSIKNSLHVAILKGDDNLVEQVNERIGQTGIDDCCRF